jgi:hypothetical protein
MISLLISLIIAVLIVGVLLWGLAALPFIDANIKQIIKVFIIVIFAIWLILQLSALIQTGPIFVPRGIR